MYASRRAPALEILGGVALAPLILLAAAPPAEAQTASPRTFAVYLQDASGQKVQAPVRIEADEATGPALPGR